MNTMLRSLTTDLGHRRVASTQFMVATKFVYSWTNTKLNYCSLTKVEDEKEQNVGGGGG